MFDWYDLRNFLEDNLIVSIFVGIAFAIAIVWAVVVFVQARGGGSRLFQPASLRQSFPCSIS